MMDGEDVGRFGVLEGVDACVEFEVFYDLLSNGC